MIIAINTRFLLPSKMEGFGWFTYEVVKRLVENHPEHTFLFFFDRPYDNRYLFAPNVIPVVLRPPARHPILFVLWFEFAVKRALKKYKADVFFSPDGYLSLRSKIPQVNVIHDLNFAHYPQDLPWSSRVYYNYFFPKFAKKAKHIVTVSNYTKQDLIETYQVPESKITVTWNGANEVFIPLAQHDVEHVRGNLTHGKPYFLFVGSIHPRKNVKRLIESYLKYREKDSTFDLVIVGEPMWKHNKELLALKHESIHYTGHLSIQKLTRVMGAAACFVYVPYFEGFGIPLVEAMQCGVPLISGNLTSLPEVVGDAALLVDPFSVEDISNAMVQISKNETLRKELAIKSFERSGMFSWDKSAEKIGEVILKSVN
jgi:glycosyltransferase involved in cell wall biosynthesis